MIAWSRMPPYPYTSNLLSSRANQQPPPNHQTSSLKSALAGPSQLHSQLEKRSLELDSGGALFAG